MMFFKKFSSPLFIHNVLNRFKYLSVNKIIFFSIALLLFLAIWSLQSCNNNVYHIEIIEIKKPWHKDTTLSFQFFIEDTTKVYLIKSILHYTSEYPFANLYVKREIFFEDNREYADTANYVLFDEMGKMTGKGFSYTKVLENTIGKGPLRFGNIGYYYVDFNHLMRIDSLPGIEKVGIVIKEVK
ncbi:MAG: gliding motility lipoprotein GldH [Thermaurantimonas sp.]|uniref:gliding motility lipoprotein GldH n=1 Tax=Thermaurantimonas sp. TaxID=2681568 RepID=UPI00391DA957